MIVKYQAALICIKDMQISRAFYEKVLDQQVEHDYGENVVFHGGFAIHDVKHFAKLLNKKPGLNRDNKSPQDNFELYFECDDLDEVFSKLSDFGVRFIHPIQEQPWGQRVLRFYDPDNHIIEIGELMPVAEIKRIIAER